MLMIECRSRLAGLIDLSELQVDELLFGFRLYETLGVLDLAIVERREPVTGVRAENMLDDLPEVLGTDDMLSNDTIFWAALQALRTNTKFSKDSRGCSGRRLT